MTIKEAIKVLEEHQEWRLGASIPMHEPKTITKAIGIVLAAAKTIKQDKQL